MSEVRWFPAKGETGVSGRFYYEKILDIPASKAADEERFKTVLVLQARVIGSNDVMPPQKVLQTNRAEYIARFPEAWAAFQGENVVLTGTALSKDFNGLPAMSDHEVMKYQIQGLVSWEQLADLSDAQCEGIGFGTRKLRNDVMTAMGRTPPGKPPVAPREPARVLSTDAVTDSSPVTVSEPIVVPKRGPGRPRKTA